MVRQLKSLARREEKEFAVIDLIDLLNRVLDMCGNILPRSVYIGRFLDSHEHAFVNAYPTQLEQAVLNLCVNASHAMTIMRPPEDATEGGTLSVSLDRVSPGRDFYKVLPGAVEGDYWVLRICDTGIGMAQDILDKIFDPFFTTKDKETGTGLGLSMVYNIIQNHKGYIEVYSEPGNGSIFNVFLPAVDNKKEGGKVADKNSATPPREAPPETKKGIFQNLGEKHRIVFR
jgi:signal transduction histidine kinase